MSTPSGFPRAALAYFGAARAAVTNRVSTGAFYQALRDAGATFGKAAGGLSFGDVNQLRSAAAQMRNAQERFTNAPAGNALDARMIGVTPWARDLAVQATLPIYHVGVNLSTIDTTGELSTRYTIVQFTGQLPATKDELIDQIQGDAEALAQNYNVDYAGHEIVEILAV